MVEWFRILNGTISCREDSYGLHSIPGLLWIPVDYKGVLWITRRDVQALRARLCAGKLHVLCAVWTARKWECQMSTLMTRTSSIIFPTCLARRQRRWGLSTNIGAHPTSFNHPKVEVIGGKQHFFGRLLLLTRQLCVLQAVCLREFACVGRGVI